MAYYFGFIPSDKLSQMFDDIEVLMAENSSEPYYKHRNLVTHQTAHELIHNMLVNLVEVIPNPERKASMKKVINTVENSTDTLLNILMGEDDDKEVLPTITFLYEDTLFTDNEGNQRVGFELTEEAATTILQGFDAITPQSVDIDTFKEGLKKMNHGALHHFVTRFAETLPLGLVKRKSVPVAKAGISKALDMAVNRLLPQLDEAGLNRLANFYRPFIFYKLE